MKSSVATCLIRLFPSFSSRVVYYSNNQQQQQQLNWNEYRRNDLVAIYNKNIYSVKANYFRQVQSMNSISQPPKVPREIHEYLTYKKAHFPFHYVMTVQAVKKKRQLRDLVVSILSAVAFCLVFVAYPYLAEQSNQYSRNIMRKACFYVHAKHLIH